MLDPRHLAASSERERAKHDRIALENLSRLRRLPQLRQLIAGGDNRNPWRAADLELSDPLRGEKRHCLGRDPLSA